MPKKKLFNPFFIFVWLWKRARLWGQTLFHRFSYHSILRWNWCDSKPCTHTCPFLCAFFHCSVWIRMFQGWGKMVFDCHNEITLYPPIWLTMSMSMLYYLFSLRVRDGGAQRQSETQRDDIPWKTVDSKDGGGQQGWGSAMSFWIMLSSSQMNQIPWSILNRQRPPSRNMLGLCPIQIRIGLS